LIKYDKNVCDVLCHHLTSSPKKQIQKHITFCTRFKATFGIKTQHQNTITIFYLRGDQIIQGVG